MVAGLKCPSTPVSECIMAQSDGRILDKLSVHQKHKEAMTLLISDKRQRKRQRKGLLATPAFILGCMASCYSNMTLHSFSPAVFDQFSFLPLSHQPSFVLKCLTTAADLPSLVQRRQIPDLSCLQYQLLSQAFSTVRLSSRCTLPPSTYSCCNVQQCHNLKSLWQNYHHYLFTVVTQKQILCSDLSECCNTTYRITHTPAS